MNRISFFTTLSRYKSVVFIMLFTSLLFSFCTQDPKIWNKKSIDQVAGDYISSNPEYSEFNKLVEMTGLSALMRIRGPYTIMLPNNDAMFAYYKLKGVSALTDFDAKFLLTLVKNHIITNEIPTGDIGLGAIRDTNAIGDFLVSEFDGADIIIDKYSKIIKRDVRVANGYIHVLDRVLDPVTKDLYTIVAEDPSYKIFTEGLKITGLKDTLQLISFPYGKKTARTRFTVLAVPDTIYQRYGINNVNDLIKWTGANPDSITFLNNPFYRYMEYHCLNGTHYLSDFKTQLYPILSHDNNLSLTIDNDYKINYLPETKKYTGFIIPASNTPAKNGVIHAINDLLPVSQPAPGVITFETTDFFDFQQEDCVGKYYKKWSDGQNTFANIKFEGLYLLYYYKLSTGRTPITKNDQLSMVGYFWIEITTPKVMKGHYKLSAGIWSGGEDLCIFDAFADGVKVASINARISAPVPMDFAEVTYTKTETHKIKIVCTGWGSLFWDTIIFTPIK